MVARKKLAVPPGDSMEDNQNGIGKKGVIMRLRPLHLFGF